LGVNINDQHLSYSSLVHNHKNVKVNLRRARFCTEMGDRVRVQFPVPDIYFGM